MKMIRWLVCFFNNLKNRSIAAAYHRLSVEMQRDADFAWTWHCNIAMPLQDYAKMDHEKANWMASQLMEHLFGVNTSKLPYYDDAVRAAKSGNI